MELQGQVLVMMKGALKTIKRFALVLVLSGMVCLWFVTSGSHEHYYYSIGNLALHTGAVHKPVLAQSESLVKKSRWTEQTGIGRYFSEMLKQIEQDKNDTNTKLEETHKFDTSDTNESTVMDKTAFNRNSAMQDKEARESIQQLLQKKSLTSAKHVLLVTYMRSGSSWLGDITKQANDSIYVFEPFKRIIDQGYYTDGHVCFYNDTCKRTQDDSVNHHTVLLNMLRLYACDYENLHVRVKFNLFKRLFCREMFKKPKLKTNKQTVLEILLDGKNNTQYENAVEFMKTCLKYHADLCNKAKYRIIKTIRMSMELVQSLMSYLPQLKVIHLVRDPRAITQSRTYSLKMNMSKETEMHSKSLCKEIRFDVNFTYTMADICPTRITMILYEALAENPRDAARYIYKFLNMEFTREIEYWVFQSSHAAENNGFFGTQRENSTFASSHWRNEINITDVQLIQQHCKDVMDLLGYVSFKSKRELRNLDIPARVGVTIPGYS